MTKKDELDVERIILVVIAVLTLLIVSSVIIWNEYKSHNLRKNWENQAKAEQCRISCIDIAEDAGRQGYDINTSLMKNCYNTCDGLTGAKYESKESIFCGYIWLEGMDYSNPISLPQPIAVVPGMYDENLNRTCTYSFVSRRMTPYKVLREQLCDAGVDRFCPLQTNIQVIIADGNKTCKPLFNGEFCVQNPEPSNETSLADFVIYLTSQNQRLIEAINMVASK